MTNEAKQVSSLARLNSLAYLKALEHIEEFGSTSVFESGAKAIYSCWHCLRYSVGAH